MRWQLQLLSLCADLLQLSIRITLALTIIIGTLVMLWWLEMSQRDWDTDLPTCSSPPAATWRQQGHAAFRGAAPIWRI